MRVRHIAGDDSGAVAVLVALLILPLTGMLALAADLGQAYSVKRRLSTAADGAALAAAQEIVNRTLLGTPKCGSAVNVLDATAARGVADDYSSNRNAAGSALQAGFAGFQLACDDDDFGLVTVRNTQTVPFVFGSLLGVGSAQPNGVATAKYGVTATPTGVRPYGLCKLDGAVAALLESKTVPSFDLRPTVRVLLDKTKSGACGNAPGNWGVLNLAGEGSPPNTPSIVEWTKNGYPDQLDLIGGMLTGNPGSPNPGALEAEMNSILGVTIILPIYDQATKSGANATFRITDLVSATLCGWKFGNKSGSGGCPAAIPPALGGASAPDYLELRFRHTLSVGEFAACGLTCFTIHGVRAIALVPTP